MLDDKSALFSAIKLLSKNMNKNDLNDIKKDLKQFQDEKTSIMYLKSILIFIINDEY